MQTRKKILESRAEIAQTLDGLRCKLADEGLNQTDREQYRALKLEYDHLTAEAEKLERDADAADIAADLDRRADPATLPGREDTVLRKRRRSPADDAEWSAQEEETRALALQAWLLRGSDRSITNRHAASCRALGFNPAAKSIDIRIRARPGVQSRALSVGVNTAGGYTAPQGFSGALERALRQFASVRSVASVMRTDSGSPMPWPSVNDTGNVGELLGENTAAATQDVVFGQTVFNAYKYSSKLVLTSNELLNDSAFNLAEQLGSILGERIGRIQAEHFTTGTGVGQPQGVVTGATLGKTAASVNAIAPDEILDLIHSVDPAYRADPSFALMMSDTVLSVVRKLKDAQGRYLFNDDQTAAGAGTGAFAGKVFGVPVVVNQQMSSALTTGQKVILAGAFSRYKVRDVNELRLIRSDERYMEFDQTAFIAFMRSDARLLDAGTNPIKYLQLA